MAQLGTPILNDIRNTNFFNGRVLTATDLTDQQNADRRQREQLASSIGTGIVRGLEVEAVDSTSERQSVVVRAGLALDRSGHALVLATDTTIDLATAGQTVATEAGAFVACAQLQTDTLIPSTGIFLLVMRQASGFAESAPLSDFGDGTVAGCGDRYLVEGVQFRLVHINLADDDLVDAAAGLALRKLLQSDANVATLSLLRNRLAHLCFDPLQQQSVAANLFAHLRGKQERVPTGLVQRLRATKLLDDCDVPLAMLFATRDGIHFVDTWSVRRRHVPFGAGRSPLVAMTDANDAHQDAIQHQFHAQISDLMASSIAQTERSKLVAKECLRYLPAAGLLPVAIAQGSSGFAYEHFFDGIPLRPVVTIEGSKVATILREARTYPPVDLEQNEFLSIYIVRENLQAGGGIQHYALFASGHVPYYGDALYDLARWNYSNYA